MEKNKLKTLLKSEPLTGFSLEAIEKRIEELKTLFASLHLDYSNAELSRILCLWPEILTYSDDQITTFYQDMIRFGFNHEQVKKMIRIYGPVLKLTYQDFKCFENKFRQDYGVFTSHQEFIKNMALHTRLFELYPDGLDKRVNDFLTLQIKRKGDLPPLSIGFTREDIIVMMKNSINCLLVPKEMLERQAQMYFDIGFTCEEMHYIFVNAPEVLTKSVDSNREKLEYYRDIVVLDAIYTKPRRLRQSLKLSIARAHYLNEHGINLKSSYGKSVLFENESHYISFFGINNSSVIMLYEIHEELREKRKKEYEKRRKEIFGK